MPVDALEKLLNEPLAIGHYLIQLNWIGAMGIADKLAQSVVPALLKALYHQCHVLRLRSLAGSSSDINTCEATIVRGALDRVEGHDQIQSLIGTGVLVKEDQKIALSTVWT